MTRRKDKKGRVLNTGESQRSDGKYTYQYMNSRGERKSVYSWKLVPSDVTPTGKRKDLSLREKEKLIQKDIEDNIVPDGDNLTAFELVKRYTEQKKGVKYNTRRCYQHVLNVLEKEDIGNKRIDKIKLSEAKEWFIKLQNNGKGYRTLLGIKSVIKPAFQIAVEDDLIRKNPFDFQFANIIINDSSIRESITEHQENQFLDFIKHDNRYSKYYDSIFILFNTGLRISEFCGLTLTDIDLENRKININHQLQRTTDMRLIIVKTKTASGTRQLPMTDDVYECFKRIIKNRKKVKIEPMIDGYTGFLHLDRNGNPMITTHWDRFFERIVKKYNQTHEIQMPKITPHVCRHTYCSNMAKSGMNPKTLQYLMGHSNINVTLNTYTHIGFEDAKAEISELLSREQFLNTDRNSM